MSNDYKVPRKSITVLSLGILYAPNIVLVQQISIRVMSTKFRETSTRVLPSYYSVFCMHQILYNRRLVYEYSCSSTRVQSCEKILLPYCYSVFCMRQFSTAYKYGIRVMSTEFRENLLPYYYSVFCIHQIQCSRADYYSVYE